MRTARGYAPFATSADQDALLDAVVAAAVAPGAVAVFDLDGCLFDTRHRQVHILREHASRTGALDLYRVQTEHFRDWDLRRTLSNAGLDAARIEALYEPLMADWTRGFFSSSYVVHDNAMPGAAALVWRVYRTGAQVVYLTGRHDEMRAGTEDALLRFGFPYRRPRTALLVKPDFHTPDVDFKGEALREVETLGRPTVFLDNEPANVNLFRQKHPGAFVVWVETDHSPRPDRPDAEIPGLRGFLRTDAPGAEPWGGAAPSAG